MLGLDLPVTDYDIIQRLQKLVHAHRDFTLGKFILSLIFCVSHTHTKKVYFHSFIQYHVVTMSPFSLLAQVARSGPELLFRLIQVPLWALELLMMILDLWTEWNLVHSLIAMTLPIVMEVNEDFQDPLHKSTTPRYLI